MPGANVFAYDGTGYKPTNRSLTAAIASRTASAYTAVSYAFKLSKVPVAISGASYGSGFGTTNYTTSTPHGFVTGEIIAVTGITPSSFNRTATITVASSTQFYFSLFDGSTGGAYASGGVATIVTNVKAVSQIWQGFPPAPSQVTFVQSFTGTAPDSTNRTTISWTCTAATTLNRFELYQKVGAGAFTAVNLNIGAGVRSYVVDGHAAATTYTYFVKSVANSGLTLSGAENSFTLTASPQPTTYIAQQGVTSSSATWRATFPAGVFQKIQWYRLVYDGVNLYWNLITSATLAGGATTNDHTWTGLAERTAYYARYILTNYNNHTTGSDVENQNWKGLTTTNQPPPAPTLTSITATSIGAPAYGSGGGWGTSGEVRKYVTVLYSIAADSDYKNHSIYIYSGASGPETFITWSGDLTNSSLNSFTFSSALASTKYWALVRQRDQEGDRGGTIGETDNTNGWQSVTTPAFASYTNANAYDTATGTTYGESGWTIGAYGDIAYLSDSITVSSGYSSTPIYSGAGTETRAEDNNNATYVAWRVQNNTYGATSVGNIRFEMSDGRSSFLKYYVNGSYLTFNQVKHNVAVQMRAGTAGAWQGSLGADSSLTRNSDPIVFITPNNNSFTQDMLWANIYGLGFPARNSNAAGAVAYQAGGNGGMASFAMRFGLRNPAVVSGVYWVHLTEYNNINIGYTTETSTTTYTNTPAVTRYY
jgi:hypothetical protein